MKSDLTQRKINNSSKSEESKRISLFLLIIFFSFLIISSLILAQEIPIQEKTDEEKAKLSINNITAIMQEMNQSGFNVLRINDLLNDVKQIYEAQKILKKSGKKFDFTRIFQYEEETNTLKKLAFQARDELFSLEKSLTQLKEKGVDVGEGEKMIQEIKQRISNEEYEKADELIESTREKIAEIESSSTGLNIFYKATKRTLLDFLKRNYIGILSTAGILLLTYILFRKRILRAVINRKIKKLEIRKSNLKKLIQETQIQYFQENAVSEGIYNIRIKKFAELTRDIDRQMPLLQEELAKLKEVEKTERGDS